MQKEIIIKKNIIGGFNRKQVIDCIAQLKSDSDARINPDELRSMQELVENYQNELSKKDNEITNLKQQLQDLNCSCAASKTLFEANRTVAEAKNCAKAINTKTKNDVEYRRNRIEEIFEKIKNANIEIDKIKNSLVNTDQKLNNISINNLESKKSETTVSEKIKLSHLIDKPNEAKETTADKEAAEETILKQDITQSITEVTNNPEENINSIDNFFSELYKMTNGKLFEPRKMPDNFSDSTDDFEYEY